MAVKMAAKKLKQMYLSLSFIHKNKWSVQSYHVKDVEFKYVEIHNNNCIISKMAANMATKNLNLVYLYSAIRNKEKWSVQSYESST